MMNIYYGKKSFNYTKSFCGRTTNENGRQHKCLETSLCIYCRKKKKMLCDYYHLKISEKWYNAIEIKFKFKNINWLNSKISEYASIDFELKMRGVYEKLYIEKTDKNHQNWTHNLERKSLTMSSKKAVSSNYWLNLIYKILENEVHLKSTSVEINKIIDNYCDIFSIKKKNEKIRTLDILGIFYPQTLVNKVNELENQLLVKLMQSKQNYCNKKLFLARWIITKLKIWNPNAKELNIISI